MTHRVEQIMAAIQTAVTGLVTTAARVDRGRDSMIPIESTPALRVAMGDDLIVSPYSHQLLDSDLAVSIFVYGYDKAQNIETLLNKMRAEVNVALVATPTLGLGFVQAIVEIGAQRPELVGDMAQPGGRMELNYTVKYRRSRDDPN